MHRQWRGVGTAVVMLSLLIAGCGGSFGPGATRSAAGQQDARSASQPASQGANGTGTGQGPLGMDELGRPIADGLMPELAAVPVPDGAGFLGGTAYTAAQDPRQTAVQDVYVEASVADATAFYAQALPGAGFKVTGTEVGTTETAISFVDPDGYEGEILIKPSSIGPPTDIHVQIHRDRTVQVSQAPVEASEPPAVQGRAVLKVGGTSYEFTDGTGDCAVTPSEISVSLKASNGFVTAVGSAGGGWFQVQVSKSELWTGGLADNSPPAAFAVDGSRATWTGTIVETVSNRSAEGTLTIDC
jgi:hypothetical protein